MNNSQAPAGPSVPLQQVYNQLPFVTAPFISTTRNTRMGRGMVVPIANLVPNTNYTIQHNLGRLVQGMICIANGANGELDPPLFSRSIGAGTVRTQSQQTINANSKCTNALLWVF
jgi:hypothetical protein